MSVLLLVVFSCIKLLTTQVFTSPLHAWVGCCLWKGRHSNGKLPAGCYIFITGKSVVHDRMWVNISRQLVSMHVKIMGQTSEF